MVTDFEEGRILAEITNLEQELEMVQAIEPADRQTHQRLVARLEWLKQHQEMRLRVYRQRVKERGIKF